MKKILLAAAVLAVAAFVIKRRGDEDIALDEKGFDILDLDPNERLPMGLTVADLEAAEDLEDDMDPYERLPMGFRFEG